ncbi:hypothetical protein Tco_1310825 [Tanacetum coccineum]
MAEENVPAPAPKYTDKHIFHSMHGYLLKGNLLFPGIPLYRMQRLGYTASNWTNSGLLLMLIFFEALEITPVDSAHLFVSPPAGDAGRMDYLNGTGYPEEISL